MSLMGSNTAKLLVWLLAALALTIFYTYELRQVNSMRVTLEEAEAEDQAYLPYAGFHRNKGLRAKLPYISSSSISPIHERAGKVVNRSISEAKNENLMPPCGKTRKKFPSKNEARIVDGLKAHKWEFPWIVSIMDKDNKAYCTGTILTPRIVITLAKCIEDRTFVGVRAGVADINDKDPDYEQYRVMAEKKLYDFNEIRELDKYYDIGLIKLNEPLEFDELHVNRICLPKAMTIQQQNEDDLLTGIGMIVAGWGSDKINFISSHRTVPALNKANLTIRDESECRSQYERFNPNIQLCAGWYSKWTGVSDTSVCLYDEGAPLMRSYPSNEGSLTWYLYGMYSFTPESALYPKCSTNYSFYVRVSHYVNWIEKQFENWRSKIGQLIPRRGRKFRSRRRERN